MQVLVGDSMVGEWVAVHSGGKVGAIIDIVELFEKFEQPIANNESNKNTLGIKRKKRFIVN